MNLLSPNKQDLNSNSSTILIWLLGSFTSYLFAYLGVNYINQNGEYIFFGPDSFYHATRILSATGDLNSFYQYDTRTQAWIAWPWAYDYLLATINTLFCHNKESCSPASLLIHIPPLLTFLNAGLLLAISSKLSFSTPFKLLLILAYAFSPLIISLHYAGRIDHHMIEFSFVLASLYLGLKWLEVGSTKLQAILFALLLSFSTGFHNGLFILQIPLLITSFIAWYKNKPITHNLNIFLLTLLLAQIIILLPSIPFQNLWFVYYFHSWFHLYITICTIIILTFFMYRSFSRKNIIFLFLIACILIAPMLSQLVHGSSFIFAQLDFLDSLSETQSPLKDLSNTIKQYTYLIYLFPLFILIYIIKYFSIHNNSKLFFISSIFFGSTLMLIQNRFSYFGIIYLFLPMLLVFNNLADKHATQKFKIIS